MSHRNIVSVFALIACVGIFIGCRNRQHNSSNVIVVGKDYPTITQALRNATRGTRVVVYSSGSSFSEASGEKFPLFVPVGVILEAPSNRFTVAINMDSPNQLPIFEVGNNVTIQGFVLTSSTGKIPAVIQAQGVSGVTIRDCTFRVRSGLVFDGSRRITIERNVFYPDVIPMHQPSGILKRAIKITASEGIVIRNNTISTFAENMYVLSSLDVTVDRNIIMQGFRQGGLVVDDASFATLKTTENCLWLNSEGMWNIDRATSFFPATGGNVAADPLFINREEPWQGVYETSPCVLAGGVYIGAIQPMQDLLAQAPSITKGAGSPTTIQPFGSGSIVFRAMYMTLSPGTPAPTLLAPQLRLWVEVDTNIPAPFELRLRDATTYDVLAEEDKSAPLRPAIRTLVLKDSGINPFPYRVDKDLDLYLDVWMQARTFSLGEYVTIIIRSMEWIYGQGYIVNDGFTPYGVPISHTVTYP